MEAMKKLIVILIFFFSPQCIFENERKDCYLDAEQKGNGPRDLCDPVGSALVLSGDRNEQQKERDRNFVILSCYLKFELDKKCGAKSKYKPVIRLN